MEFTLNQKKAHDLNRHISVTAGAGSGKTAVLVHRYLKILLEKNLRPNQVVAITFTEKAAAKLKQRIVREINARLEEGNHSTKLEAIKAGMISAQISTIHSFCARILREYPVEAGVDAGFNVLQRIEQQFILNEIIDSTLKSIADRPAGDAMREKLADLLRIFGKRRLEERLYQLVSQREAVDRLIRDLYNLTDAEVLDYWHEFAQAKLLQSLSDQFPIERWLHCLDTVLVVVKGKNAAKVRELAARIQPDLGAQDAISILGEIAPLLLTQKGEISKRDFIGARVKTDEIEAEIDFLVCAANHFQSFPAFTDDDVLLIRVTRPLLAIYDQIQHVYERHKLQQGQLDFDDLQIKVRDLLQNESICARLVQRYPYIMVDEYQDTNRLQYEILKPLISDFQLGNLFIVGDQKQSIYGFRGADVRVFHQTRQEMTAYQSQYRGHQDEFVWYDEELQANDSEKRGDIHLPENFRLLRNLVGCINLVFQPLMETAGVNEFEVVYEPLIKGRATDQPGDVELIIGSKGQAGSHLQPPIDENELIGARIRQLIGASAMIWERNGDEETPRPIRYGDIAILIRSRTHLPEIESALLNAEIPYKITGGIGFYQRQEIYDIGNYLQFLVNPDDDVALAGVLRAPFFGISDVELYEISQRPEPRSFWQKVQTYTAERISKSYNTQYTIPDTHHISSDSPSFQSPIFYAVETLRHHQEICHRLPISRLIRKIVNDTSMVGVLPVGQQGKQRWANYEKLLDIAREFESAGFTDLFDFLERLNLLIEEEEREGQATTQLTEDTVQVMTVHAAKGFEFPVVILPHLDRRFRYDSEPFIDDVLGISLSPTDPENGYQQSEPTATQLMQNRAKQRTDAEEKRLFYVAATRARDRLVLSGTLDWRGNAGGWFGWLLATLGFSGMPHVTRDLDSIGEDEIQHPVTIEALSGAGTTPISFDLPIRIIKSLDALDFVEEDTPAPPPPAGFPAFHVDSLRPSPVSETFSVTQLATYAHCPTKFYLQHRIQAPISDLDPESTARGTAVHEVLAQLRTQADCDRDLEPLIRAMFVDVSVETVREHVENFLNSEIGVMALSADERYCERHIYAQIGSHLINGIVDRLFKDSAGLWHLIDYKTDAIDRSELADSVARYRPQIELYALLVHRLHPPQVVIPATIFFTHLAEPYSMELTGEALEEVEGAWLKRIEAIQVGTFEKNAEHCPMCPYFVDSQCLVSN